MKPGRRYETPAHLYPASLVADEDGGDAGEFVLPEDLSALSAEFDDAGELTGGELHDLLTQAEAAFDGLSGRDDITAEDLQHLTELADAIESIRTDVGRRQTEAAERAEAVEAQRRRVHGEDASAGDGEDGDDADGAGDGSDDGEGADGDGDGDDEGGDGGSGGDGSDSGDGDGAENREPALTAAGGRGGSRRSGPTRVPLSRVRREAPRPSADEAGSLLTITASADVPGFTAGGTIEDFGGVTAAAQARARALGKANGATATVATFHLPDTEYVLDERSTPEQIGEALRAAANPESLTAAGGWCAPEERVWEFFSLEAMDGLIDLPTVTVRRAGLEWPVSPSIADLWDEEGIAWEWTEDDDIDALDNDGGPEDLLKPCFRIPCGTWDDERLAMWGICISAGNLSSLAWPEQNRRYIDLSMAANAHIISARLIARMVAKSIAANPVPIGAGAATPLLAAIELQVLDYRSKYRASDSLLLEAVFPSWVLAVIRADLSYRRGVDLLSVTNAEILGWFRERGIVPQFVADWQPLHPNTGGPAVVTAYPGTVQFLLYAAGTFSRGRGGTIDLGVVRDSRLNEVNDHIALWTEEANLVAMQGHESRLVTVAISPTGAAFCCPDGEPVS